MPKIVNREEIRMEIIMAFQRCIQRKPIDKVSLRDIAAEAGMSHPKILDCFRSKDELILSYVRYTKDYMNEHCKRWFAGHSRLDYESNFAYINAFIEYVANGEEGEFRPNATTQTYVLGHYSKEIGELVTGEFREWRETMEKCLTEIYGEAVGKREAEAMMILISGIFICNYNRALTGEINGNIIGCLAELTKS